MINFNIPPFTGKETEYMAKAIQNHKISGDGEFTKKCNKWIEDHTGTAKALLTTSCTHATEMAALLADIKPGDEVIMPSYTFVSTADAFVLRGATAVFVDIRPDTMNIDETLIEDAITDKTRAIVPVHYAGVSCEMDTIMDIAKRHNLLVIEDAAQGVMSSYKGKALGTIGDYGCFSFFPSKNLGCFGDGGMVTCNDPEKAKLLKIFRKAQDYLVRLNWQDEVIFPQEAASKNIRQLEKASRALSEGNITDALKALYRVDNNMYAFLFDEEVYYHFTEYILHQPKDRLMWGAGRIMHHENLYGIVQKLKQRMEEETPELDSEIRRLEAALRRQKAYYKDDIRYLNTSVNKLSAMLDNIYNNLLSF